MPILDRLSWLLDFVSKRVRAGAALRGVTENILKEAYGRGRIRTVYDIGAHKGRWARQIQRLMPGARLILFEANPLHKADLAETGFEHYIGVLGQSNDAEVPFFFRRDDAGSTGGSTYKEKTPQYADIKPVCWPRRTLASLVAEKDLPLPDLVKLDTQGAEIDVIAGGRELIAQANYVLMELPVVEYNCGAPSFDSYTSVMKELEFFPVAVSEIHRYGPIVIQLDFLFVSRRLLDEKVLSGLQL
jgi:FkbM family methyltransferase